MPPCATESAGGGGAAGGPAADERDGGGDQVGAGSKGAHEGRTVGVRRTGVPPAQGRNAQGAHERHCGTCLTRPVLAPVMQPPVGHVLPSRADDRGGHEASVSGVGPMAHLPGASRSAARLTLFVGRPGLSQTGTIDGTAALVCFQAPAPPGPGPVAAGCYRRCHVLAARLAGLCLRASRRSLSGRSWPSVLAGAREPPPTWRRPRRCGAWGFGVRWMRCWPAHVSGCWLAATPGKCYGCPSTPLPGCRVGAWRSFLLGALTPGGRAAQRPGALVPCMSCPSSCVAWPCLCFPFLTFATPPLAGWQRGGY